MCLADTLCRICFWDNEYYELHFFLINACIDMLRIRLCSIHACDFFDPAEKRVRVDFAYKQSLFAEQIVDAAIIQAQTGANAFGQTRNFFRDRVRLAPSAQLDIRTKIAFRRAFHGGDRLSAHRDHA